MYRLHQWLWGSVTWVSQRLRKVQQLVLADRRRQQSRAFSVARRRKQRAGQILGRLDGIQIRWALFRRQFQLWVNRGTHRLGHAVMVGAQVVVLLAVVVGSLAPTSRVYAGTTNYDFSVGANYSPGDAAKIEVASSTARLKSQQYATDGNTSAYWRFDESETGAAETTAEDTSANNNDITFGTTAPCATDGGDFGSGKINNAVTLNGIPNCVTAADSPSLSINGVNPSMTIEALVKFPNAFDADADIRQGIVDKGNYRMYFSESDGKLKFEMHDSATKTWNKVGGSSTTNLLTTEGLNSSWRQYLPGTVQVLQEYNSSLYIGTLGTVSLGGTAEVWKYSGSGTTWTKVAGDELLNDQWDRSTFEGVMSMTVHGGLLYIGLGYVGSDGELWAYDDSPESLTRAIAFSGAEEVTSLVSDGTYIYAGLGSSQTDADVWRCQTICTTSGNWSIIGGTNPGNINSSWGAATTFERVRSMVVAETSPGTFVLYVGLGDTTLDAEVWKWWDHDANAGTTNQWLKVGGDGIGVAGNVSWNTSYEAVMSLAYDATNDYLYAGLGLGAAGDAEIWRCVNCDTATAQNLVDWDNALFAGDGTGWANTVFESVRSLVFSGGVLFASLGDTVAAGGVGDGEVWKYWDHDSNGGTANIWTQIGGDGLNTTWDYSFTSAAGTNVKEQAYLGTFGSDIVVGTGTTPQDAEVWWCTSSCGTANPTWSWIGGRNFSSWGAAQLAQVGTMTIHDGKLYIGFGSTATNPLTNKQAVLWEYDGSTWTQIGGGGLNGSNWEKYEFIRGSATFNGDLYVGTGDSASDADVWKWNGSTWTQVGGDEVHGTYPNWNTGYEYVSALVSDGTSLYAGFGLTAGDAEVWAWNGATWTKIGGDTTFGSWGAGYEHVWSMAVYGSYVYAGLGNGAGDSELYRYNASDSTRWRKIGGDAVGTPDSWDAVAAHETIRSMTFIGTNLYVGLGDTSTTNSVGDAEVWVCSNCTDPSVYNGGGEANWTQIGGDDLNNSWNSTDYEWVSSLIGYNGDLYAGLGFEAGESELWKYDGASWSKVGGDGTGTPASWSTTYESLNGLTVFNGRLYAGLGNTNNTASASDAEIWEYGGNTAKVTISNRTSWSANTWYHIAAVYNGTDAKLYIDGIQDGSTNTYSVTLNDNNKTLSVGNMKSPFTSDGPYGGFTGTIDELRISNTARAANSFVLTQYSPSAQTVQPSAAKSRDDVLAWSGFSATATLNGGTINYRLSDDNAATWKYWDGDSWETSNSTSLANTVADVNTNIGTFPVTDSGILWQGILDGNGDQQVILNSVDLTYTDDTTDPVNPNAGAGLNQVGGATNLTTNTWYNYSAPQFSWSGATDTAGSGIRGYYVYFGTSSSADPVGAGSFQTGTTYVPTNMSSGSTYYLRIKARDYANNVEASAFDAFTYKFDSTAPTGPSTVSVSPSGYTSVNNYQFFWPTSGSGAASDLGAPTTGSAVAGYQYRLPNGTAPLNDWSTTITDTSITIPNAATTEGPNTFELRPVDNAGNTGATVTATFYYAGSAPSHPQGLTASPPTTVGAPSANNSFSFTWNQPEFFNGSIKQYHYSVNKLPTSTNTSATTQRSLAAAPYATQQGKNTFYVVAEDEAGNINFNDPASVDFYTQTPAPEMPTALQIFDISNRDTQEYAISMKWTEPTKAAGFDGYQVQRSEDNVTFVDAGTTKSPVFIDTNLSSKVYYFRIRSQDNAGQVSAFSTTVNLIPTGRFTSPPKLLDGPSVSAKSFSATMSWTTDRVSSSFVEYGTDTDKIGKENGGDTVGQLDQVTAHAVALKGLEPETVYHYRAVWVDQDGNRGQSDLLSFTTGLRPKISDVKITNITLTSADISWVSTTVASSTINFGTTRTFGQSVSDVSGSQTTKHTLRLDALTDATTYYFVITGKDTDENSLASDEYSFTTLTRPRISSFAYETVKDSATTAIRFSWTTNVPTTSIVAYGLAGQAAKSKSESEYVTEHSMVIEGLSDNTPYTLQAKGVDQYGNATQSDSANFTTPDDSRPPKVLNMTIEVRSTGVGAAQKAQLVVSWETDEPSGSQVEYGPGISSDSYPSRTQEDTVLSNTHVVIVPELEPAKLYHLRAVSRDRANNAGTSSDTTAITGKVQRSVVDIIISSLQRSLGFLSAIPGLSR